MQHSTWFLANENVRLGVLVVLLCACALLGGTARADVVHLVVLRPIGVLCAFYALLVATREELRTVRAPLFILLALMTVVGLQLVPLPSIVWSGLPTHAGQAVIDAQTGVGEVWRPISLDPDATASAFFALFVPLAALVLAAGQGRRGRSLVIGSLMLLAVIGGMLGLLQMFSGSSRLFYIYPVTNFGSPVGFLANRNHQAVFMAAMVALAGAQLARLKLERNEASRTRPLAWLVIFLALPVVLASESRAGIVALAIAAMTAGYMLISSGTIPRRVPIARRRSVSGPWLLSLVALAFVAVSGFLFIVLSGSSPAELSGMTDQTYDLRFEVLPIAMRMAGDAMPLGIGAGAFPLVFRAYEPVAMVEPRYLNHAHNDWVQPFIELGVPGALVLVAFVVWLAAWAIRLGRSNPDNAFFAQLGLWFVIVILVLASGVDYPLRTPLLMAVAATCAGLLGQDWRKAKPSHGPRSADPAPPPEEFA